MQRAIVRTTALTLWLTLALGFASSPALAQYKLTNLTSNRSGKAKNMDPLLVNAWGLVYAPGSPFWVSDEGNGWSTLYDGAGVPQSLQVVIPPASGSGAGSPTGIAYNGSSEFKIDTRTSAFLFATLDGTIQGWSHFSPNLALIGVNNSGSHASYTGLAITSKSSGNFLYAADTANNKVDVYDGTFKFVTSFTDSTIPKGFVVFGIQDINGQVYVSYVSASGGGGGYIDIFKEDGTFVKRFAHGKPLNQPWGFAVAPRNFGSLSNTLLISNNTNAGTINGFNLKTGKFVGTITNAAGKPIKIDQLWGIEFGGGSATNGKKNQLFFTAGPNNNVNGLFGVIAFK
ncbi:MAG TPA: TIGR03118 family protein [Terriglobales bacterium]|nr:TIGR03118 family protein [Terriglobales bacterium]